MERKREVKFASAPTTVLIANKKLSHFHEILAKELDDYKTKIAKRYCFHKTASQRFDSVKLIEENMKDCTSNEKLENLVTCVREQLTATEDDHKKISGWFPFFTDSSLGRVYQKALDTLEDSYVRPEKTISMGCKPIFFFKLLGR